MSRTLLLLAALGFVACGDKDSSGDTGSVSPDDTDIGVDEAWPTDTDIGEAGPEDNDGDGYTVDEDCDDANNTVHPGADEVCDGIDNDCDGTVDNDDAIDAETWYADTDADGYGDEAATATACDAPSGYVADAGDCDDADSTFNPAATEDDCADPNDYNCDGSVGYADEDGDGWAACEECDDASAVVNPDATEVCDGIDNDCDEVIDPDTSSDAGTWYLDFDADGYGADGDYTTVSCDQPSGYVSSDTDCDDLEADAWPGNSEVCDEIDNDCDGAVDDDDSSLNYGSATLWYADADGDGFGDSGSTALTCDAPSGYIADDTDCDDSESAINPDADEVCDGDDNDCDGAVDDDDASLDASTGSTWYADDDIDAYGDPEDTTQACDQPDGYVADSTDCDDDEFLVNPGNTEICDDLDNDCDGVVDPDDSRDAATWYSDADLDGYGDADSAMTACEQPSGYLADDSDCDDSDAALNNDDSDGDGFSTCQGDCDDAQGDSYPGNTEVCDGADNDCDGTVDDDDSADASAWYADDDGDGYGDPDSSTVACDQPSGYLADIGDCDDSDADISPDATEICDGIDNDCDGSDLAGEAVFEAADGTRTDLTTTLGAGASGSPVAHTLSDAGSLYVCEGTWYTNLTVEANVDIVGSGEAVLSGGATSNVVRIETAGLDIGIEGVTITEGAAVDGMTGTSYNSGGGVYCDAESSLTISDTLITANTGSNGAGAAFSDYCSVTISDSTFSENVSASYGGGFGIVYGDITLTDVDILDNQAGDARGGGFNVGSSGVVVMTGGEISGNSSVRGGGFYNNGGDVILDGVTVSENTASAYGGGNYSKGGTTTISGSTISDNYATTGVGGLLANTGTFDVSDSVISGNSTDGSGGGMSIDDATSALTDVQFLDNVAGTNGGGALVQDSSTVATLTNVTFEGNDAATYGGGLYMEDSADATLSGCDFTDNLAASGGGAAIKSSTLSGSSEDFSGNTPAGLYHLNAGVDYDFGAGVAFECDATDCLTDRDDDGDGYSGLDGDTDDTNDDVYPGAPEYCDGVQNDSDDTGWTSDAGTASFEADDGSWTDLTSTFAAGTYGSPASYTLSSAGTLRLCEGTWYGHVTVTADADIVGADGADLVTLSGGDADSVIRVDTAGLSVGIYDLTITEGLGTSSATGTSFDSGGGLYCDAQSDVTIDGVDFVDNTAVNGSGAFFSDYCDATISNSSFSGGSGSYGGGITVMYSDVALSDVDFHDNDATYGGAAYLSQVGTLSIDGGTFSGNAATQGAVVYDYGSPLDIADATFDGNSASDDGGVLFMTYSSEVTVTRSAFTDNTADDNGGAIYHIASDLTVANSDFSGNSDQDLTHATEVNDYDWGEGASFICDASTCTDDVDLDGDGYTDDSGGDCDETDAAVNPGVATDECDGVDDDCDGSDGDGVVFEAADGTTTDLTGTFEVGTYASPVDYTFSDDGTFRVCQTLYAHLVIEANVDIVGASADAATLSGGDADHVIKITTNGLDVSVSGVTITEGRATRSLSGYSSYDVGGGLHCDGSSDVTISDAIFTANAADIGGAVSFDDGCDSTITDTVFSENDADDYGGAALFWQSDSMIDGCDFTDNWAGNKGGAMFLEITTIDLNDTTFESNTGDVDAGAIFIDSLGSTDLTGTNVDFIDNDPDDIDGYLFGSYTFGTGASFSCTEDGC